jgi:hypothetical protein
MAQVNEQHITVGSNRIVGTVSVDGGAVRGEGGPIRPQLVVPVTIKMSPQAEERMMALTWINSWLTTSQPAMVQNAVAEPVQRWLLNALPARSFPNHAGDHREDLRFFLTPWQVEDLEQRRHAGPEGQFQLYLGLDVTVAAVRTHNSITPGQPVPETEYDPQFGMYSELRPFWNARVDAVWVQVEQSTWVRNVLPGLGYDRLRLVELTFPPALPGHSNAAAQFDKARRALDERRYADCIRECRGLLNMWEKHYGATSKRRIAEVIAADRQWPVGDVRRKLLDILWKEVGDVANAPHHPEGDVDGDIFDFRDARLLLLLTSALSEYVQPR